MIEYRLENLLLIPKFIIYLPALCNVLQRPNQFDRVVFFIEVDLGLCVDNANSLVRPDDAVINVGWFVLTENLVYERHDVFHVIGVRVTDGRFKRVVEHLVG